MTAATLEPSLRLDLAQVAERDALMIETASPQPLDEARAKADRLYGSKGPRMYARALEDLRTELRLAERREAGEHVRLRELAARLRGAA